MLESVSSKTVHAAVEILGTCERVDHEVEKRIRALVAEDMTARRLIDIIPEAFGIVLLSHMPEAATVQLPATFAVQDAAGEWRSFPLKTDPVFAEAIRIAQHIFHSGPRHIFRTNADRSSVIDLVNKSLNKYGSLALENSRFELSFTGLPASLYEHE